MTVIKTDAYHGVKTSLTRVGSLVQITLAFPDETAAEMAYADLCEVSLTKDFTVRIKSTGK